MYQYLLSKYPIISDQIEKPAMGVVLRELEKTLEMDVKGDVVELGCYIGTTSLFIRRLLDERKENRRFYAYDSFEGLPEKNSQDSSVAGDQFREGELSVTKKQFLKEFHKANLQPPTTYKVWFKDIQTEQLPEKIAFAFLDGDFYKSILDSLKLVWPRLSAGGVLVIDDYQRDALPGVERAVNDFFGETPSGLRQEHNIGIMRKP